MARPQKTSRTFVILLSAGTIFFLTYIHGLVTPSTASALEPESPYSLRKMSKTIASHLPFGPNASTDCHSGGVVGMLPTIRSQIALFSLQHGDMHPTMAMMRNWKVFLNTTDVAGNIVPNGPFGPYVQTPPQNPTTGSSKIAYPGTATIQDGWTYNPATGEFKAVVRLSDTQSQEDLDFPAGYEVIP